MGVLHHVVLGLGATGISGQPPLLAQGREVLPSGQQFVHVRLMTGVENDGVMRGIEDAVNRHRDLNDAKVRPEVPPGARDRIDEVVADLVGQITELLPLHQLEVGGAVDCAEQTHEACILSAVKERP